MKRTVEFIVFFAVCFCPAFSQKKAKTKPISNQATNNIGIYSNIKKIDEVYSEMLSNSSRHIVKDKYETEAQYRERIPKADTNKLICVLLSRKTMKFLYDAENTKMKITVGERGHGAGNNLKFSHNVETKTYDAVTVLGVKFEVEENETSDYALKFKDDEYINLLKHGLNDKNLLKSIANSEAYFRYEEELKVSIPKYSEQLQKDVQNIKDAKVLYDSLSADFKNPDHRRTLKDVTEYGDRSMAQYMKLKGFEKTLKMDFEEGARKGLVAKDMLKIIAPFIKISEYSDDVMSERGVLLTWESKKKEGEDERAKAVLGTTSYYDKSLSSVEFDTVLSPDIARYYEDNLIPCMTGYIYSYDSNYYERILAPETASLLKPKTYDWGQWSFLFKPNSLVFFDEKKKLIFKEIKFH